MHHAHHSSFQIDRLDFADDDGRAVQQGPQRADMWVMSTSLAATSCSIGVKKEVVAADERDVDDVRRRNRRSS